MFTQAYAYAATKPSSQAELPPDLIPYGAPSSCAWQAPTLLSSKAPDYRYTVRQPLPGLHAPTYASADQGLGWLALSVHPLPCC